MVCVLTVERKAPNGPGTIKHGWLLVLYVIVLLSPSSVNHGILVCIECSGAHRSMGVQISQVWQCVRICILTHWNITFCSCNMGTHDLPEMYACSLRAAPSDFGHTFQANHECPCYSYYVTLPKANSLNAKMSTSTGFFLYVCLKGLIMVMQQVTL